MQRGRNKIPMNEKLSNQNNEYIEVTLGWLGRGVRYGSPVTPRAQLEQRATQETAIR